MSPLHPGSQIRVSSLSQLNLTSIWVLIFASHNCILVPSKHHLKPKQVSRCVSQLHRGPFSIGELYLSSIVIPYHPNHVSRSASELNPGPISTPSRSRDVSPLRPGSQIRVSSLSQLKLTWVLIFASRLHPRNISPPARSTKLHFSSIEASSQTLKNTGYKMCVSPPSRSVLNWRIVSQLLVPYHPIHVSRCASQLKPCHISTPSRFCRLNCSPLKAPSWCNSSPKICVSPSSRSCITCIQVPIFFYLNYKYSDLTFTFATSIQVPIITPHHNPGHISPQSRS